MQEMQPKYECVWRRGLRQWPVEGGTSGLPCCAIQLASRLGALDEYVMDYDLSPFRLISMKIPIVTFVRHKCYFLWVVWQLAMMSCLSP